MIEAAALPPGAGTDVKTSVVVGGGVMAVELGGIVEESILRSFKFTMTIILTRFNNLTASGLAT